jgi:hypothetical protein
MFCHLHAIDSETGVLLDDHCHDDALTPVKLCTPGAVAAAAGSAADHL